MKPFDLQKALAGEPVVTRDGRPVTGLHLFDGIDIRCQRLYGVLDGAAESFCDDGIWASSESGYDLFMAAKKRTVYVNLYKDGGAFHHKTRASAEQYSGLVPDCIAIAVPVEIEE